mgnify:FL=1
MSSYFWNQIKNSTHKQKLLKESYSSVLLRQAIAKIKPFCLFEEFEFVAEKTDINNSVKEELVRVFPGWVYSGKKSGAIRMLPSNKTNPPTLTPEQIKSGLESIGYKYIASHAPQKHAGAYTITGSKSRSGKFITHEFEVSGLPFLIVFGGGSNEGGKFEDRSNLEMAEQKGEHPLLKPLLPLIAPDTIASVETRTGSIRRPFTGEMVDVGHIIGDTVINGESGKKYFLSLKHTGGSTISNHGCAGIFTSWDNGGKLKFNPEKFPAITNLLNAAGMDPDKVVYNLTQYINAALGKEYQTVPTEDFPISQNLEYIQKCILSSIGFGYYYARQKIGRAHV